MEPFQYPLIDLEGPAFRLLRLLAGTDRVIRCELFQNWLGLDGADTTVPYQALSYCWGDEKKTEPIQVNGQQLYVTSNLFLALQHLRLPSIDRILWIDAICINQGKDAEDAKDANVEKAHQVRQMGDIYQQAESVIFWLGHETTDEILELMDCLELLQNRIRDQSCKDWKFTDPRWQPLWAEALLSMPSSFANLLDRLRAGLQSLLERPWFKRVWILQEVAKSRKAVVCCGGRVISARTFALAPELLAIQPSPHCQAVLDIMPGQSRSTSWWSQRHDLYTLLKNFRGSQATHSRDRVYALLGISSDANDTDMLRPNYEKIEAEVVSDVLQFLFYCDLPAHRRPKTVRDLVQDLVKVRDEALQELATRSDIDHVTDLLNRDETPLGSDTGSNLAACDPTGDVLKFIIHTRMAEVGNISDLVLGATRNESSAVLRLLHTHFENLPISDQSLRNAVDQTSTGVIEYIIQTKIASDLPAELLAIAARQKTADMLRFLLHNLPISNHRISEWHQWPCSKDLFPVLIEAVRSNSAEVIRYILHYYANNIQLPARVFAEAAKNTMTAEPLRLLIAHSRADFDFFHQTFSSARKNKAQRKHMLAILVQQKVQEVARQEVLTQQLLMCADAGPDHRYDDYPFIWAARAGYLDLLDYLFSVTRSFNIYKFILQVAQEGHEAVLRHLLSKHRQGATIKELEILVAQFLDYSTSKTFENPLIWAAQSSNIALVDFLLETMGPQYVFTIFSQVVKSGSEAVLGVMLVRLLARSLREVGSDTEEILLDGLLRYRASRTEHSPINWAADDGSLPLVRFFTDIGADLHLLRVGGGGLTPLYLAAGKGHADIVGWLLARGAEADVGMLFSDRTPLSFAIVNGHEAVVKLLLAHGARVSPDDIRRARDCGQHKIAALLEESVKVADSNKFVQAKGAETWQKLSQLRRWVLRAVALILFQT